MLTCATPSLTRYCAIGRVMLEEYSPMTAGTLSTVASLRAAVSAVLGLFAESSTMSASFLPSTPARAAVGVDLIGAEHEAAADVLADGGGRAGQRQHGTDRYTGLRQRGPGRAQRALQRDSGARCKP